MVTSKGRYIWLATLILGAGLLGTATGVPGAIAANSATPTSAMNAPDCPRLPDPTHFVDRIDNRYFPLEPGTTFTYRETADGQTSRDTVEVTTDSKLILGVTTTVVRDTATTEAGDPIEKTLDWYAQDTSGNVWYFGEETAEYENGLAVSTKGSWEAGVDGALPGIVMSANPQPGDAYSQECAPGVARDAAKVLDLATSVAVPFGSFDNALVTEDWNSLEPDIIEHKTYAPCVGLVQAVRVKGGVEEAVLVDVQKRAPAPGMGTRNC